MNGARHQTPGKAVGAEIGAPVNNLANSVIVRQHADDDFAIEQVYEICRCLESERHKVARLLATTHVTRLAAIAVPI